MAKLINSFLKKQTFRQIFPIFARENKDILSKYRLNTNETNHTHHRRSTFRQKHLCGKAGTRALSTPVYLATARIWDEEFHQRVIRHQERRGPEWTNIEEQKELSRHRLEGRIVLIDCITLWCTNFFFDLHSDTDRALAAVKAEFDCFTAQDATFIFVTNEIGMGGTSENELQRKFTDMQGWMNQYVAARADEVILMVSGIPLTVKNTHS